MSISFCGNCMVNFKHYLPAKKPRQTEQTQIGLLLKKQSDQGLPCLLFW